MITVYVFMIIVGSYAAEWDDFVPKIKARGLIPYVANIFSGGKWRDLPAYEPSGCKATLILINSCYFYLVLPGYNCLEFARKYLTNIRCKNKFIIRKVISWPWYLD
jgi:hypothetical protein